MPTQRERREATIAKLLDASIATIDEIGYSRASVKTIATRAGLSYGALFRHFPTMSDFMAATAREAVRRQMEAVATRFLELTAAGGSTDIGNGFRVLREVSGTPAYHAILELTMAARTDLFLRSAMQQAMLDTVPLMIGLLREVSGRELDLTDEDLVALTFLVADVFDSEVFQHPLREHHPEISERRIPVMTRMLGQFRRAVE
ncbi:TetR/AcrR family transcriptional regulator [Nocardia crassostreae]|uniref:TetR/AcrR family transcriptional regulator n=1 Tax=Nocardia crassostreae TaxID=53428 RepID=UPI00082D5EA8|nr:TetR/AcrR family transcriptional regulator [Nocardia crassostreae]